MNDKNPFSLQKPSLSAPRTQSAIPRERAWTPIPQNPRRSFSSYDRNNAQENVEALAESAAQMDDAPAYLADDAGMHRPHSTPRFGALRTLSSQSNGEGAGHGEVDDSSEHGESDEDGEVESRDDGPESDDIESETVEDNLDPTFADVDDILGLLQGFHFAFTTTSKTLRLF